MLKRERAFSRKDDSIIVNSVPFGRIIHEFTHFQHHKELTRDEFLRCDKIFIEACFGPSGNETDLCKHIKTLVFPYVKINFMKFVAEINTMFAFHKESEVDGEEPRDVAYERNSGNVAAEAKPEEVVKGEIPELNDKENTNLKILRESMAALIEKPGTEEPMKLHVALKGSVCSFKAIREAEREVIAENTGLAMENPGSAEEGVPLVGVIDGAVLPGETKVAPMLAREEADIPPTGKFPVVETFIEEAA